MGKDEVITLGISGTSDTFGISSHQIICD